MNNTAPPRFALQDSEYEFPYHYLPQVDVAGRVSLGRTLSWGLEYLAYHHVVREVICELQPHSVLEVGCGDGRFIGSLPNTIPVRRGVDLSERAIRFAQAFHPEIQFECTDVKNVRETFDVVVAVEVLEHIPDDLTVNFLTALRERTRPGGWLVLCVPTTVLPLNPKHYRHYDQALIEHQLTSAGMRDGARRLIYAYQETLLLRAFRKLTHNRLWTLEIPALGRSIWRHLQQSCLLGRADTGHHLIVIVSV